MVLMINFIYFYLSFIILYFLCVSFVHANLSKLALIIKFLFYLWLFPIIYFFICIVLENLYTQETFQYLINFIMFFIFSNLLMKNLNRHFFQFLCIINTFHNMGQNPINSIICFVYNSL